MTQYNGPKIVLTRICVAMSGFIIHSAPDHWGSPITDIISMFSPHLQGASPNMRSLTLLLELLTVIPEEFQTLILSSSRRSAVRHTFAQGLGQVLPFLLNVISHHSQQQDGNTEAVLQVRCHQHIGCLVFTVLSIAGVQVCQGMGPVRSAYGQL